MTGALDRRGRFMILSSAFVLTGAATVTLGLILPELREAWSMGAGRISWLFTAQFTGSAVGSILSTRRLDWSLLLGYGFMGVGLLLLAFAGSAFALIATTFVGLGLGGAIPATNLRIAYDHPENRGAALAKLNLIWGLGTTGFPLILAMAADRISLRLPVAWIGAASLLAVLPLLRIPVPSTPASLSASHGSSTDRGRGWTDFVSLIPFAAIFFCYVGTEATFGGWMVSLASEFESTGPTVALLIGSSFWAALLIGRGLAAPLLRNISENRLYWASLAVAGLGTGLLITVPRASVVWLAACLGGLGLASIFPLTVSLMTQHAERLGTDNTGWVFAAAGLGGASIPWLVGQITEFAGATRFGFAIPLLSLTLVAIFFYFLTRDRPGDRPLRP